MTIFVPGNSGELRALDSLVREMSIAHVTERGTSFVGLIVQARRWIYWDRRTHTCHCERCGTKHVTPDVPESLGREALEMVANHLSPFDREHRGCTRPAAALVS